MSPGDGGRLVVLQIRSVESKQHIAEVCEHQLIGNLHVHTAHEGGADVDVGLLYIAAGGNRIASDATGVGLAHDLVAILRESGQAVGHDDSRRQDSDLPISVAPSEGDVVVVEAAAESRD